MPMWMYEMEINWYILPAPIQDANRFHLDDHPDPPFYETMNVLNPIL